MIVVVDASVALKWYVKEDHTSEAEYLKDGRFELHAPQLLLPEFGNIIWKKCRNDELDENTAESIINSILEQDIVLHPHKSLLKPSFLGAKKYGQAIYDWTYLSLAISLDCPFVTADRKFYLGMRNTPFTKQIIWVEKIPDMI